MLKFIAELTQLSNLARTAIVPRKSPPLIFTGAAYDDMLPFPLEGKPIAVFVLVQLKLSTEAVFATNAAGVIFCPGQTAILDSEVITGVGLT
jgi:hypothetical protein